jgi:2-polyprenyl-3-methyl-5-hydroxy-6-metoxy-1,4-benzoquinol methylase
MPLRVDPEQNEVLALKGVTDWHRKRVLEIGCGDGRLTRRLAQLGAMVYASDPDAHLIRTARRNLPQRFAKRIHYEVGQVERVDHPSESFEVVVFAWVL